jgi:transposase
LLLFRFRNAEVFSASLSAKSWYIEWPCEDSSTPKCISLRNSWEAYAIRAGIESTISQAVRVSDLRQARYLGLPKTHRQHVVTATAINVKRIVSWLIAPELAPTQVSRFAALALQYSKPAA